MARLPSIDDLSNEDLLKLQNQISYRLSPKNPLDELPEDFRKQLHTLYKEAVYEEDEYVDIEAKATVRIVLTVDKLTLEAVPVLDPDDPINWNTEDIEKAVYANKYVKSMVKNKTVDIKRLRSKIKKACRILSIKSEQEIIRLL